MRNWRKWNRLMQMFRHYRRCSETVPYLPLRLWVELTNVCNLRCVVCPNSTDRESPRGFLDLDVYKTLIHEIAHQANDINLSHRGESLFHPDLLEMLELAAQAGIATRLHTNATTLTRKLSRELLHSKLGLISFSFDGACAEDYEALRVGASFDAVLNNILGFLEEKARLKKRKPYTVVQVIDMSEGAKSRRLDEFRRRFEGLPLDKFYVKRPHNWAGNIEIDGQESTTRTVSNACTFPWYSLTVLWDGVVVPCPQDWFAKQPMGRLPDQSLREIWNSESMRRLRRAMSRLDPESIEPCDQCDRVCRPTWHGVPTENLKAFLGETLAGYALVRKLVRR